jgi:molybdopterin synthase catalytic subunit
MDISKRIAEMKQKPDFVEKVGMVLVHNGVVRAWSRNDRKVVKCLEVTPDYEKIENIRQEFLKKPGIFDIVVEAKKGNFLPGDDLLYIIVAGDIREHVKPVLADLLDRVKSGPISKKEIVE